MKYYNLKDTEVVLYKRISSGWKAIRVWGSKREALHGLVAYNLWCEFRKKEAAWYSPWARESDDGGDVADLERYYPVLDTAEKVTDPSVASDYSLEVKSTVDKPTENLEAMGYFSSDYGVRHLAAIELSC